MLASTLGPAPSEGVRPTRFVVPNHLTHQAYSSSFLNVHSCQLLEPLWVELSSGIASPPILVEPFSTCVIEAIRSMGSGKTIVVLCSAPISTRVCRYRN